jgi:GDP-L-fucose synthase
MTGMHYVFHLAAAGYGFHANLNRQAKILTDNLLLNTTVLDTALKVGIEKYLFTSSIAVYPSHLGDPEEDDSLDLPPHGSEQYYAWAKRMGEIQARAYYEQFQLPIAIVRPANPYGPRDNFDPQKSHVIPALIRRAVSAENPFMVWGSGAPQRSFIYIGDVVRAMLLVLEKHAYCDPINIATGQATSIAELVEKILLASGNSHIDIKFDTAKPDGLPRRVPKAKKLTTILEMANLTPIEKGLSETIRWYKEEYNQNG